MTTSAIWGIPLIPSVGVSQSEVLHNEAVIRLEVLAHAVVIGFRNGPPDVDSPAGVIEDGDVYLVGTAAVDRYAGQENKLVLHYGGAEYFLPDVDSDGADIPIGSRHKGYRVYVQTLNAFYLWDGSAWVVD
jgi:hypothetical protein